MSELLPCPFCGHIGNVGIQESWTYFYVRCYDCDFETKAFSKPALASAFWNTRVTPPADQDKPAEAAVKQSLASEPDGWREFIEQMAAADGGMINGNRLAAHAKRLLQTAATLSPAAGQSARMVQPNMVPSIDANIEANRQALLDRSNVGIQKYGVTTDKAGFGPRYWLNHALEENLDAANYLRAAISRIDEFGDDWHKAVMTICTMIGVSAAGSPEESCKAVQDWLAEPVQAVNPEAVRWEWCDSDNNWMDCEEADYRHFAKYQNDPEIPEVRALGVIGPAPDSRDAEIERLRAALSKYGRHGTIEKECAHMKHSDWACDCGFDEAMKGARE